MNNIEKIQEYILSGCSDKETLGLELEHLVCDKDYAPISYAEMEVVLREICEKLNAKAYEENSQIYGMIGENYSISIEPGCQLEISVDSTDDISQIEKIYNQVREACDLVLEKRGFYLLEKGLMPLVEMGEMTPDTLPLIPKKRYILMDEHFQKSGKYGAYMMRATASTQVSVDFKSEADAVKKFRILEKITPILALLTENRNGIGYSEKWDKHLLRTQIWNELDPVRGGYLPNSLEGDSSKLNTLESKTLIQDYAEYIYKNPCILLQDGENVVDMQGESAETYFADSEMNIEEHVISMYFHNIRIKKFLEIRVADSMKIEDVVSYLTLIKKIVYNESVLDALDKLFAHVTKVKELYAAEKEICRLGYGAEIYGKPICVWIDKIIGLAKEVANDEEKEKLDKLLKLPMLNYYYRANVEGNEDAHIESAKGIKSYLLQSTAKYHERVVRTLYVPKIFTKKEVETFEKSIQTLYGIFEKVIQEFEQNSEYRGLFEFSDELNTLILREKKYSCSIPIARIDIFYNDETGDYKFCEFNTDGSSAMNEDRELNNAFSQTKAYKTFTEKHPATTFELFDTWVEEVSQIYREYADAEDAVPNIAIVDFMEHATENEFKIFKERFEQKGIMTEICDIREISWDGSACYTPSGMKVDLIYRRAVTTDIMSHYDEIPEFIEAVRKDGVCLVGDFRTQIAHNKVLYKILHMDQTQELLTKEEQIYVKAHVPMTTTLSTEIFEKKPELYQKVLQDKDGWIIKPEDSYGSKGVHAGVEYTQDEWEKIIEQCTNQHYILQEFYNPYRLTNIDYVEKDGSKYQWVDTSNLTGMFVYNGAFKGIYSRISFDKMISTQYNEMSLPTILV